MTLVMSAYVEFVHSKIKCPKHNIAYILIICCICNEKEKRERMIHSIDIFSSRKRIHRLAGRPDDGRLRPNRLIVCQNIKVNQRREYKINNVNKYTQYEIVISDDFVYYRIEIVMTIIIITMIRTIILWTSCTTSSVVCNDVCTTTR